MAGEIHNTNSTINIYSTENMFRRIAKTNAVIKSQQRDENDLSLQEKFELLNEIYSKDKLAFISRFGKYLDLMDLELFKELDDYEIQFYVKRYSNLLDPLHRDRIIKNRRYNYLKNVLKKSDYFDDEELKKRNPLLYRQYVGQYVTYDENFDPSRKEKESNHKFSQLLFDKIDDSVNDFRCMLEQNAIDEATEEEDDESDSDIEQDEDFKKYLGEDIPMESEERFRLHEEFVGLMENRFLAGDDDFDYSIVDNDEQYDDLGDQDIEDRYFDDDECDLEDHYFDDDDPE